MGYYTLHKISIINKYNNSRNLEKLHEVIEEVTEYCFRIEYDYGYIIDDNYNCGSGSKWYTFDDDIYVISERLPKLKILVEAEKENGTTWERIVKNGYGSTFICSSEESSDNEEDEENEDDEEDEDNEENEEEIINEINDIGIEEEFLFNKINDNEIFQR